MVWGRSKPGIKIENVRLRNKKDYCKQHPGPCPINPFFPVAPKHWRATYLEGADWVGFNDGLNDVLDRLHVDADVFSFNRESRARKFFIRKGKERRHSYFEEYPVLGRPEIAGWIAGDKDDFGDYCGVAAPRSSYTHGTPGFACWTLEQEEALRAEEVSA